MLIQPLNGHLAGRTNRKPSKPRKLFLICKSGHPVHTFPGELCTRLLPRHSPLPNILQFIVISSDSPTFEYNWIQCHCSMSYCLQKRSCALENWPKSLLHCVPQAEQSFTAPFKNVSCLFSYWTKVSVWETRASYLTINIIRGIMYQLIKKTTVLLCWLI